MRITTLGKLFRPKVATKPAPINTAAMAQPIDIKESPLRMQRHSSGPEPRWMLKPTSHVTGPCLRAIVAGKLEQRTRRALRRLGCKPQALDAMLAARQVDVAVRDRLLPEERVLLHFCVGGEAGALARYEALRATRRGPDASTGSGSCAGRSPMDGREEDVLDKVLQPFRALRALFDLEDATGAFLEETPERLCRAVLEAFCDDPAGVQAQKSIAWVACDFHIDHGGLFKVRQRVNVAQMEMLTGNAPSEPAKITQALDSALQHLAQAGFPDVRR